MNSEQQKALKKASAEIRKEIDKGNLSPEEKEELERLSAQIAGLLAKSWFPSDWGRRLIMIVIAFIGFIGLIYDNKLLLLCWLILPLFSPRLMAEMLSAIGSKMNRGNNKKT